MGQPYVGEIRMFGGNFPPVEWEFCEGQLVLIRDSEVLFQLIGTTYGGDGETTFGLPDLRGRVPLHQGNGVQLAQTFGVEQVTLNQQQIPVHTHTLLASRDGGTDGSPAGRVPAQAAGLRPYYEDPAPGAAQAADAVTVTGGSQPHENMQPFLAVNFIISLYGIFPSQT